MTTLGAASDVWVGLTIGMVLSLLLIFGVGLLTLLNLGGVPP